MGGYIKEVNPRRVGSKMPAGRKIAIAVGSLLMVGVLLGGWAVQTRREISGGVLRLHILANSDGEMDQLLKQAVRDRVLEECGFLFQGAPDVLAAEQRAIGATARITEVARRELRRHGCLYPVTATVEETVFPTKSYGGVRLPAGRYRAVNVRIGAATGQNWWCVLYPPLCLTEGTVVADADTLAALRKELSAEEYAIITETEKINIKMKFRILEFLGEIFSRQ